MAKASKEVIAELEATINGAATEDKADSKGIFTKYISASDSSGTLESSGRKYNLAFQSLPPVTELDRKSTRLNSSH